VSLYAGVGDGPTGANSEHRKASGVVIPDLATLDLAQAAGWLDIG